MSVNTYREEARRLRTRQVKLEISNTYDIYIAVYEFVLQCKRRGVRVTYDRFLSFMCWEDRVLSGGDNGPVIYWNDPRIDRVYIRKVLVELYEIHNCRYQ